MKTSRSPLVIGCLIGVVAALIVTTLMQAVVYLIKDNEVLAWNIGLPWSMIIAGPARVLCGSCGWDWDSDTEFTVLGFCSMLLLNSILWALLGSVLGYCTGHIFKSRTGSIVGSSLCFVSGVALIIAGFNNGDGLWLKNWGAFLVLLGGVILCLYPTVARKRVRRAQLQSPQP